MTITRLNLNYVFIKRQKCENEHCMKPILHLFQTLKSHRQPRDANWDGSQYTVCFNCPKPITMTACSTHSPAFGLPTGILGMPKWCRSQGRLCGCGTYRDSGMVGFTRRTTPGFMCVQSPQTTHTNPQRDDNRSYDESCRDCQG